MALELKSRVCGTVHIVECKGHIVAGAEGQSLESVLRQDWCRHLNQVVLHVGEVTRLDSMGLGLIVRHVSSLRQRGGDLRLTDVCPTVMQVLEITRIDTVVKVFASEQEAVLSYLSKAEAAPRAHCGAGCVMVVDPSPDFCAFATALLTQHGYEVKSASLVRDARILLQVHKVDFILVGPSTREDACEAIAATFRTLAPKSRVMRVDPELKGLDPHEAAEILLQMLGSKTPSN